MREKVIRFFCYKINNNLEILRNNNSLYSLYYINIRIINDFDFFKYWYNKFLLVKKENVLFIFNITNNALKELFEIKTNIYICKKFNLDNVIYTIDSDCDIKIIYRVLR